MYLYNIYLAYTFPKTLYISWLVQLLGFFLAIAGLVFWVVSYINLGWSFGVLPQKQKRVTKGLYRYFKHPMYMGIFLTFLGLSLANMSFIGLLFTVLVISPILLTRAYFEQKKLLD